MTMVFILEPPTIQETPAADGPLFRRFGIHRGITIVRRMDDSVYTTRFPAQTELEEAKQFWLGGYQHVLTDEEATFLTDAGFGVYIHSE